MRSSVRPLLFITLLATFGCQEPNSGSSTPTIDAAGFWQGRDGTLVTSTGRPLIVQAQLTYLSDIKDGSVVSEKPTNLKICTNYENPTGRSCEYVLDEGETFPCISNVAGAQILRFAGTQSGNILTGTASNSDSAANRSRAHVVFDFFEDDKAFVTIRYFESEAAGCIGTTGTVVLRLE